MNYRDQQIYIQVVKNASITQAAEQMGISKASVSRVLKQMELQWETQLLNRSTRGIRVTDAGQEVYEHCLNVISDLAKTRNVLESIQEKPTGTIRVTVPEAFGIFYLVPIVKQFLNQYPDIQLDIFFSSDYESLVEENFDLAVRIGKLADSQLKAKKICQTKLALFASPSYLKSNKPVQHPKDLLEHNCLIYMGMPQHASWFLAMGSSDLSRVKGNIRSNNEMFLIELAKMGQGILLFPEMLLAKYIENGELESLMPHYANPINIYLLFPFAKKISKRLRLFIDFIANAIENVALTNRL